MKKRTECLAEYGSDYLIQKKIKIGKLFRVDKAIYSEKSYIPELVILIYKYPKAIVTMHNAFYIHELTDAIP